MTRHRLSEEEINQREDDARRFMNLWKSRQVARASVFAQDQDYPTWSRLARAELAHSEALYAMQPAVSL